MRRNSRSDAPGVLFVAAYFEACPELGSELSLAAVVTAVSRTRPMLL
jgi:hypothetical protein